MLETIKSLWAKWKVQISIVGGVLILSTVWGTCSYTPAQVEEADEASEVSEDAVEEVSNSSEAPAEVETTNTTTTATTTTTENNTVESEGSNN